MSIIYKLLACQLTKSKSAYKGVYNEGGGAEGRVVDVVTLLPVVVTVEDGGDLVVAFF